MPFLRKYNTLTVTGTTAIRIPIIKRAVVDFAIGADWTPAAGDVKIAVDGAAAANVTNLPTAVAMGNGAYWEFILTAAELTCKSAVITVADSATKAVEDQSFIVETFGHASAMYPPDFTDTVRLGLTALPNAAADAAGGLPISDAGGLDLDAKIGALTFTVAGDVDVNVQTWGGTAIATPPAVNATQLGGDTQSLTDLKDFADAGYDPATNKVQGVVLVDTATDVTNERGKYSMGAVWIGPSANTNTVSYVDGIITNPVSTIAAAKTIADALNIRKFYTVRTGASQIAADIVGYSFDGTDWSLTTTGGSRDVGTSAFANANVIGGTFAATSGTIQWDKCRFDTGVSIGSSEVRECLFGGTLTLNAAGDYDFIDCVSDVPGATAPVFALGTGAMNIGFRRWSGGITFSGITADDVLTISGELGTINLGSPSGAADVQIRGTYKAITNVGSATVNVTGAILAGDVASILADTGTDGVVVATASKTGYTLTATTGLGNQTADITGTITTVTTATNLTNAPTSGDLTATMKASVNAEVLDVLNVDTFAEETGIPAATSSLRKKIGWMFMWFRNRVTQTSSVSTLYADDGTTPVGTHTVSDNATTFESTEGS